MTLNKPPPSPSSLDEVIVYVENMIIAVERQLIDLARRQQRPRVSEGTITVAAQALTRRRTLIEVWEHATNRVWKSPGWDRPEDGAADPG